MEYWVSFRKANRRTDVWHRITAKEYIEYLDNLELKGVCIDYEDGEIILIGKDIKLRRVEDGEKR